ncbi:MAG: branched-chain-amino-acid transaminase [Nocardioides sp.]
MRTTGVVDRTPDAIGFGGRLTAHSVVLRWTPAGWSRPAVSDRESWMIDPTASVLHYGQSVFEGLKAFRQDDGTVALFRPWDHGRRFARSARRMAMPALNPEVFVDACLMLVDKERDSVPDGWAQSLYVRPYLVAVEAELGLRPAREYRCEFLALPADPCYGRASAPMSVMTSTPWVRATLGGTGDVKCSGNYAAGLLARNRAVEAGCQEVLWMRPDGTVEEFSTMNCFVVWHVDGALRLSTPADEGTLMPGITRLSLLQLARDLGMVAVEQPISLEQIATACQDGRLVEMFAAGTAAGVVDIGSIRTAAGARIDLPAGTVWRQLRNRLLEHQHGVRRHSGWTMPVPEFGLGEGGVAW